MHFPAFGHTVLQSDEEPIDAVAVKNGAIFIVLSTDTITLWHTDSLSRVQSIRHVTATLESIGFNRRLYLREDDMLLVVETSGNVLLIYDICEDDAMEARLLKTAHDPGIPKVWLKHRQNVRVEAGVLALCATAEQLIISTKRPPMIQSLLWSKEGNKSYTESAMLSTLKFLSDRERKTIPRVSEIVQCGTPDTFLWLMNSGEVYVARYDSSEWNGSVLHDPQSAQEQSVLISFNKRARLATLSLADNQIVTYSIRRTGTSGALPKVAQVRSFSCALDQGSPRSLSWSPDGSALLICCEYGWSLRSTMGTLVARSHEHSTEKISHEVFRSSVWLHAGYSALFLPLHSRSLVIHTYAINKGHNLQFLKRLQRRSEESSASFFKGKHDTLSWTSITLPSQLRSTGPMIFSSFASFDQSVAVGGRYGLAHYSRDSAEWRVFRTLESAESCILTVDPVWVRNFLVAAVRVANDFAQIHLFSRGLDLEVPLKVVNINGTVVAMTVKDDFVFVLYSSRRLEKYEIVRTERDSITMLLRSEHKLQGDLDDFETSITVSVLIHEAGNPDYIQLLILEGDRLQLFSLSSSSEVRQAELLIADGVEWFQSIDGPGPLRNAIFAYCRGQMKLWVNISKHLKLLADLPLASATFDLDFYPLTVSLESGLIDGLEISQSQSLDDHPGDWKMSDRSMTFLPKVLKTLVGNDHLGDALVVTSKYAHLRYFSHILEILLSEVLEEQCDKKSCLLKRTWLLLDNYESLLPDIVVSCARKADFTYWETLFEVAGDPRNLYKQCLERNDLKTAAAYLIILHTMDEQLDHKTYTLDLCRQAALQDNWELVTELCRFYCTVADDREAAAIELKAVIMVD